jgi:TonB-linked SusC/RagA family outer membrane protein
MKDVSPWQFIKPPFILATIFCLFSLVTTAQQRITGKVVAGSSAVEGATVQVKGLTVSTQTDVNGNFSINAAPNATLVITFVGYEQQEVKVGRRSSLLIKLKQTDKQLDEVVVVGYGMQKKESMVGAIVQVKGNVLEKNGGVPSIGAALTGSLPGVITVATTGQPGAEDPRIYIRGQDTWNNTNPLVLVDGIERSMSSVDIGSVESISVLKDASATAVFGVKGANGVILITTKHGRVGKPDIRFTTNTTMKVISKLGSKYDSYDAIKIRDLAIENELGVSPASWGNYVPNADINKYRNPANQAEAERYPNIDWQNELIKKAAMDYHASMDISGGTPFVKYFVALDYLNEGDIIKKLPNGKSYQPGYGFNRTNVRANLDFNLTKTTVLTANLAGSYGVTQDAYGQDAWQYRIWQSIYSSAPDIYYPKYLNGGWGYFPPEQVSTINSLAVMANNGVRETTTTAITTDFSLKQDLGMLLKGLSAKGTFANDNSFVSQGGIYDNGNIQNEYINPVTGDTTFSQFLGTNQFNWIPSRWSPNQYAVENNLTYRKLYYQLQLEYARKFGKHDVTAMGLFSRDQLATGSEFPHFREDWVSRVTYNYNLKYFAEFNGAYNGSEKFGPNNRFAFFPSAAGGWMVSKENFMKDLKFINMLKFRVSWGQVGSDNIANRWLYMTSWTYGGNAPLGSSAYQNSPYTWWAESSTGIGNPDIHWEKATKTNYGVDYSIMNGLLSGSIDVFSDYRTDILLAGSNRAMPSYFGITAPTANLGKVRNKGYEFELHFSKMLTKNLHLHADLNATHAKNRIIEADDPELEDNYLKKADKQIGQYYSNVSAGYESNWDQVYGSTELNIDNAQKIPGTLNMIDYNGDGVVDSKDVVPAKYSNVPQNTYNATIGIDWKGFSAFVQFYAVNNVSRYLQLVSFSGQYHYDNVYKQGSYWSKDNPNADVPMPRYASTMPYYGTTYLYDGAYLRLKNAEIAYTFKLEQLKRIGINALHIFLNGDNLLLWTKMPDDREVDSNGGAQSAYPTVRRINLGCNITF